MSEITLNIYGNGGRKAPTKVLSCDGYDLMLGTVEDFMDIIDLDKIDDDKEVLKSLEEVEKLIAGKGRALLRKSGTEPVIRIMIESETEEKCHKYAEMIAKAVIDGGHKVD